MTHATMILALRITIALAGFGFGLAYFAILRRTVVLFVAGRGWRGPLGLTLARLGAAALFFGVAVQQGAAALLAALLGFLLARTVAVPATRKSL